MIERKEYRGCLKKEWCQAQQEKDNLQAVRSLKVEMPEQESGGENDVEFAQARAKAEENIRALVEQNVLLTASLYVHARMCFLYYEALVPGVRPEDFLAPLAPYLEIWHEADGDTPWAPMYAIYWHSVPKNTEQWEAARRNNGKRRIGRIAFLKPEKLFSYTYWHQAIVEEGLLKGDMYQFISLHENILFSYFEEPRGHVNIRGVDVPSNVIEGWMAADPESHFERERTGGENFMVIEPLISVGRSDCSSDNIHCQTTSEQKQNNSSLSSGV